MVQVLVNSVNPLSQGDRPLINQGNELNQLINTWEKYLAPAQIQAAIRHYCQEHGLNYTIANDALDNVSVHLFNETMTMAVAKEGSTGRSPKISIDNTWLLYNDELGEYEDSGISIYPRMGAM